MAITYKHIVTATVTSATASSVVISNIPNIYQDLMLITSLRGNSSSPWNPLYVQMNSTVTGNTKLQYGTGSGTGDDTGTGSIPSWYMSYATAGNATASIFSAGGLYLSNYNSSFVKQGIDYAVTENDGTPALMTITAGANDLTSAITSLTLTTTNNWVQYTSFTLYGIKNTV